MNNFKSLLRAYAHPATQTFVNQNNVKRVIYPRNSSSNSQQEKDKPSIRERRHQKDKEAREHLVLNSHDRMGFSPEPIQPQTVSNNSIFSGGNSRRRS